MFIFGVFCLGGIIMMGFFFGYECVVVVCYVFLFVIFVVFGSGFY